MKERTSNFFHHAVTTFYIYLAELNANTEVNEEENLLTTEITPNDHPTQSTAKEIPQVTNDTSLAH